MADGMSEFPGDEYGSLRSLGLRSSDGSTDCATEIRALRHAAIIVWAFCQQRGYTMGDVEARGTLSLIALAASNVREIASHRTEDTPTSDAVPDADMGDTEHLLDVVVPDHADADVDLVMGQTQCTASRAREAIVECNGDILSAVMLIWGGSQCPDA
jgi:NACalpha-BTF3-like transcription factor